MKAIVMIDKDWGIGKDGQQPIYLPGDMKRFKRLTQGGSIIFGRRTLATFPHGAPLPGRQNFVLSRNPHFCIEGATVCSSVEEVLSRAPQDAFVVGGGSIYWQFLPYCDTIYLTKLEARFPSDSFFPFLDEEEWDIIEEDGPYEEKGIRYSYITYSRRKA